jgi:hypothetical protein
LEEGLSKEPDEVVPYKIFPFAVESVEQLARSLLALFNTALLSPSQGRLAVRT